MKQTQSKEINTEKTLDKVLEATAPAQTVRDEAAVLACVMVVYGQRKELLRTGSVKEIEEYLPRYNQRLNSLAEESPLAKRILNKVFKYKV